MIGVASRRHTGLARGPALFLSALLGLALASALAGCRDSGSQRLDVQGAALERGFHLTLYADSRASDMQALDVAIQSELVEYEQQHTAFLDRLAGLDAALPTAFGVSARPLEQAYRQLAHAWLIDSLAAWLDVRREGRYFLEVGGDVRTRGTQAGRRPWQVALEQPTQRDASQARQLTLDGQALATAGDFRDRWQGLAGSTETPAGWWLANGRERVVEVSVLADTALEAAAWAGWLLQLPPEAALSQATRRSIAAYFIVTAGTGYDVRISPAMTPHLDVGD
ncbi:ApbE family protein [Franzmannia pantelleriensis]|uniref:FAD:protein FMN transferase n=1 Tax=Franzmannia pantelleriensis TaxID=48727 RepID=A0A1G9WT16_9GAMM|nr:FAD:protein FMN transferase [Halomonas pantelleriensis]SDM87381.1 ApbE family protein [Halomonas pantelleriensis]